MLIALRPKHWTVAQLYNNFSLVAKLDDISFFKTGTSLAGGEMVSLVLILLRVVILYSFEACPQVVVGRRTVLLTWTGYQPR
jgi:hypothetical protein